MNNYTEIVRNNVHGNGVNNVQNIVGKQIRNIVILDLDNMVKNNVERTIWITMLTKIINNRHKLFNHCPLQQYKNNI
jgi:hypothetical protein